MGLKPGDEVRDTYGYFGTVVEPEGPMDGTTPLHVWVRVAKNHPARAWGDIVAYSPDRLTLHEPQDLPEAELAKPKGQMGLW